MSGFLSGLLFFVLSMNEQFLCFAFFKFLSEEFWCRAFFFQFLILDCRISNCVWITDCGVPPDISSSS